MIIECKNCNKKFNVSDDLIPNTGRQIQCGSCNYKWFYKIEKSVSKIFFLDNEEVKQEIDIDEKVQKNSKNKLDNKLKNINKESSKIINKLNKTEIQSQNELESNNVTNFFSYLLVLIISFISLIIIVDTFKTPLISVFPGLEIILTNLYETLKDIKLFIIDLS